MLHLARGVRRRGPLRALNRHLGRLVRATRYERRDEPGIDAWLDREQRLRLREEYGVLPEFVEAEAKRVIAAVFRTSDARTRQTSHSKDGGHGRFQSWRDLALAVCQ